MMLIFTCQFTYAQTNTIIRSDKVNTIWQGSGGNDNFGNGGVMQQESFSEKTRCLIQFDFSSIPSNANITSATLRITKTNNQLCDNSGNGGSSITIGLRRLTVDWLEGSGCNNTGNSSWINSGFGSWSGGTFDNTNYGSFTASANAGSGTQYDTDVLSLVNFWRSNPSQNFGLIFVNTSSDNSSTINFFADEGVTDANKPQLLITYSFSAPTLSTSVTNVNCNGANNGSINLTVTGGNPPFTYLWSNGATSEDISGLAPGTYTVTVTNTGGGSATTSATITQPAVLNASVAKTNATCFGQSNGTITVSSPSGGSGSYQYRLDAGTWQSSGSFTGLAAGTYSVQIRDANNTTCVVVLGNQTITQPVVLAGTINKTNVTCFGLNNGTITVSSPSGGSGSYQYRLNIGSWQSSGSFTGLAPGSYLVQMRDANNTSCEVSLGIENVTQPAALISNGVTSNVSCNGGNNGAIVQTVSGGTSPYSYVWSDGGPTTKDRSMLTAGMYTVTITDNNSCVITRTYNIIQSTTLTLTADVTPPQCALSGSIILTVSGGSSPYNFDWADLPGTNNPQNRSNISVNGGNFSVTVTDQNGCSATGFYPLPAINCGPGQIVCIEGNNAAVYSVTPDPFVTSYNWTVSNGGVIVSGQGTPEVVVDWTGATAGTGQICVSTENDCGESAQTCKNIILRLVDAHADVNQPCTGGNIELSAEGGVSYQWSGPGGFTSNLQNPVIYNASGSNNGTYVVTVTDDSGCSATASVAVTVSVGFTLSADVFTSACGQNIGAVDITVTGGTSPFVYLWSNGETSQDITDLPGGNYMVTVTDANLCTGMISGSVGDLDGPTLTASSSNVTCNGGNNGSVSIVVSGGSPPINFLWSNGATTQNISGLTAGIYNVVAIDAFGCVGSATGFVNQPNPFQVNISRTNLSCFGSNNGSITLNVTGGTPGYTYNWSDIGSGSSSRTGLAAGAYSVTISDALSCTTTRLILITQPTAITGSVVTENVVCFGQSNGIVKLTVSGGSLPYTYNWQGPSGFTATTKDINGLIAGTYNVTVTDARGCTFTQSGTVNQPAALSLSDTKTNVLCNGRLTGSINLTVSGGNGGYLYQWSNGQTTEDISGLGAGTYTVLVTDNKACTATRSISITEPTMINVTSLVNDVACFGTSTGSVNVNVTGGTGTYSFVWSDGGPATSFRNNLAAGNYVVTVTDANNCTNSHIVVVDQNDEIEIEGVVQNVLCNGGNGGQINVSVNGGVGPYTYAWSNGLPSSSSQNNLVTGNYTVTVTDLVGCTKTAVFTVSQPPALSLSGILNPADCFGSADGGVNLTVTGGVGPYTYAWSNGTGNEDLAGVTAGTYIVTVSDLNNCTSTASYIISEPTALTFTSVVTPNCLNQTNGSINLTVSGGTPSYTFTWSGAGTGSNPRTGLAAGQYFVTVTDANLCSVVSSFQLTPLTIEVVGVDRSCASANGRVIASASGGVQPYTYLWSNGGTAEFIQNLNAGTYSVTVTSGSCSQTGSASVTVPANCLPPDAVDDFYTTPLNTPLTGTVMPTDPNAPGYDSDPFYPLDSLTFESFESLDTLIGTIVWDSVGGFVFTPVNGYIGTFTLDYLLCNPLQLCDTATLHITVAGNPSWTITKTSVTNPNNYNEVGDILTYVIELENTGNVNISAITVSDPQATTGPTYVSGDTGNDNILSPGEIWIYGATYTVQQVDIDAGSFTNVATASGTTPPGTTLADVSDDEVVNAIQNAAIQLVKTSTTVPNRYSYLGDVLTYNLAVTNTGNVTLTNVVVSDPVAVVSGSPIASLAPNQTVNLTATYVIQQADLNNGQFVNVATAVGNYTDLTATPRTVSDTDDETIPAVIPDVTPVITAIPNVMTGKTEFNLTVRVTELNSINTNGLITVRIPKDARLSFKVPYNPSLTILGNIPLNNANWAFSQDAANYIFTSMTVIPAGSFSTFGFVAEFDPGFTKGVYTLTSQIASGSGGEIRIDNNVDSEKIDYFIE
jgi:uncharacterized repeat protein (TIGR01451 family)